MATVKENENPVFDYRTLRMVIGALAFGLPFMVYVFAGKITTSISASYHEQATRNMFVGSLFIIGALLISYEGHRQDVEPEEGIKWWKWIGWLLNRYQEYLVSTIGGVAAVTAALFPTACDKCNMDRTAYIHMVSAFLLFANVVYFCNIAFLRSLNRKLLDYKVFRDNATFMQSVDTIRTRKTGPTLNPVRIFWDLLTLEAQIFRAIVAEKLRQYQKEEAGLRFFKLLNVHGKKFARGIVYVVFGFLTFLVLLVFVILAVLVGLKVIPDILTHTRATFVVETFSLWFFGVAWMTASQLEYFEQTWKWWGAVVQRIQNWLTGAETVNP